jgi:hypothetical protein
VSAPLSLVVASKLAGRADEVTSLLAAARQASMESAMPRGPSGPLPSVPGPAPPPVAAAAGAAAREAGLQLVGNSLGTSLGHDSSGSGASGGSGSDPAGITLVGEDFGAPGAPEDAAAGAEVAAGARVALMERRLCTQSMMKVGAWNGTEARVSCRPPRPAH